MSNDPHQNLDEAISEALGKAGGARAKTGTNSPLSWREVMKDTLQEASSGGSEAAPAQDPSANPLSDQRVLIAGEAGGKESNWLTRILDETQQHFQRDPQGQNADSVFSKVEREGHVRGAEEAIAHDLMQELRRAKEKEDKAPVFVIPEDQQAAFEAFGKRKDLLHEGRMLSQPPTHRFARDTSHDAEDFLISQAGPEELEGLLERRKARLEADIQGLLVDTSGMLARRRQRMAAYIAPPASDTDSKGPSTPKR